MFRIKIFIKNRKTSIKILLLFVFIAYVCFFILVRPAETANGAKNGLLFSANTLIPSLFPFMFLSSFVIQSGFAAHIGKYLSGITERLFGLPGYCSATVILSMIGGYPVGARGVKALYEQGMINEMQAEKMMCFCVGAGPAFIISVVGQQMMHSTAIGIILFVSQIISSILMGILANLSEKRRFFKHTLTEKQSICEKTGVTAEKSDIITATVKSCEDCCAGMLNMCAFVVLFSAFLAILNSSGIINVLKSLLNALGFERAVAGAIVPLFLEVMGGCKTACEGAVNPVVIAFGICWGGFCVHFQLFTALSKIRISKGKFWTCRLLHGGLAALVTYACILAYNPALPAVSELKKGYKLAQNGSVLGSCILITACIVFLVAIREETA